MRQMQLASLKNFLIIEKMENQGLKSMTSIQRKISFASINSNDHRFTKVIFEQDNGQIQLSPSFVYQAAIQGCTQVKQKIMEVQGYGADTVNFPKTPTVNKQKIEEPKRLHAKMTPNIQKVHSPSVSRSKSQHKTFNSKARALQGSMGMTMAVVGFSNQGEQQKRLTSSQNPHKQTKSIFKNTNALEFSRFNQKGQNGIRKTVPNKIRLKNNSVISLSSELTLEQKHNKCVPLQKSMPNQQLEESFWENAYRLGKCEVPAWYQIQRLWSKAQEKRKSEKIKNTSSPKQTKKIIYEGYDFNGELIPSTNLPLPQKGKKPLEESSQINIQLFNEDCVENLSNYNEKQQRSADTYQNIKITSFDCNNQKSQFLVNLQRLSWTKNVLYKKREQKKIEQEKEKTKESIKIDKQHQQNYKMKGIKSSDETQDFFSDQIQGQETKIINKEELIENYDRIKFGLSTEEVNQENNFPFSLSKYLKVKKFQEKQIKSKSFNYHTVKYFPIPYKDSYQEIPTTIKLKPQPNNSSDKVRANKRLFKQVFNMSLKRIDPENREDIITVKLIKDREKQNTSDQKNKEHLKRLRKHCTRNSDTLLLKKGFCIKPTVFKQIQQNQKNIQINDQRKNSFSKASNFVQKIQTQESIEGKNYIAQTLHQGLQDSKSVQKNSRKGIDVPSQSLSGQNIEKMFKKQTKKTLIKHFAQDFRRQSFV